jgi:hypothetical protein
MIAVIQPTLRLAKERSHGQDGRARVDIEAELTDEEHAIRD